MASLADELLADFASDEENDQQQDQESNGNNHQSSSNGKRKASDPNYDDDLADLLDEDDDDQEDQEMKDGEEDADEDGNGEKEFKLGKNAVKPSDEMDQDQVEQMDLKNEKSVNNVSKLKNSSKMKEVMEAIDIYAAQPEPDVEGVLEESPEYQLIVRANNLAVDVDNEIMVVHKFIRDHYSPRFPELETLILNPWEFVQAVKAIGNEEDMTKAKLEGILPHGTVVVISMTASTTTGKSLPQEEWERVTEACDLVYDLESARRKILQYVESRMTFIAPNLSAVVGTRVATKLLGVAGGLTGLSKIPACNVHLLGASKKVSTGFSTAFSGRHNGFIFQSELVQNVSEDYHRQAQRIVSAKALLTARMDANASARDGSYGKKLREELEKKLEKLQEPPPAKMTKALPVPKEGGKKNRRGGRRARKAKEAAGMTELRKMQNRVEFGKEEEETGAFDETRGLGMINSTASGKIRAAAAESRGKAKMSKKNQNRLANLKAASSSSSSYGGGETSGTASSLSFTPIQGIELVDPSRQKKVDDANAKWFQEGQFSLLPGAGKGNQLPGSNLGASTSSSAPGSMGPPSLPRKK